ncbi:MAG: penicillin-binding transpeptidase domain-containing protein [Defluviitaleaceae bacterium]|nr:penicillin-binding transpeptidase domain-containing protein [Defluviitaleaceae bacterium]
MRNGRRTKATTHFDEKKRREKSAEEKRQSLSRAKLLTLGFIFTIALGYLILQVYLLIVNYGEEYRLITQRQQEVRNSMETRINPNRGSIFDRNNQLLAASHTAYNIIVDIRRLDERSREVQLSIFEALNHYLDIPLFELDALLEKDAYGRLVRDTHHFIIERHVDRATAFSLVNRATADVFMESESIRSYTFDTLAASILGFRRGDTYWGLERQYNEFLTGVPGRLFRTYSTASAATSMQIDPQDGFTLITTIDANIQRIADEIVLAAGIRYEPEEALIIVMNPHTGEIIAMSSYPTFNANDPGNSNYFGSDLLRHEFEYLESQERLNRLFGVWANFGVSGSFEPGSTFKPIIAAAALDEGAISRNQNFFCAGGKQVADHHIRCWAWRTGGHGNQTLTEAIANSCNVAFMEIGIELGRDRFFDYQRAFGFGQRTGIDLPGEFSAETLLHSRDQLNITELATGGMGQGFNATSIQILTAFAALVNGGDIVRPYVVSQVIDRNNRIIMHNTPQVARRVITEDTANFLRREMQMVVSAGTGGRARIEGFNIGGKTGTGEQGVRGSELYTYSFVGYLTIEDPRYIAIAVIHLPREDNQNNTSGTTATPMIGELFERIIQLRGIQSGVTIEEIAASASGSNRILVDYIGQNIIYVTRALNALEVNFEISGRGDIVSNQMPRGGLIISDGLTVHLHLTESEEDLDLIFVPDILSSPIEVAKNILTSVGFEFLVVDINGNTIISQEDDDYEFFVVRQMPTTGTMMLRGSQIRLIVEGQLPFD